MADLQTHPSKPATISMKLEDFTLRLLIESLFYDDEYDIIGQVSLVDSRETKERYIASYAPEKEFFLIEHATRWETETEEDNDAIGYALAVDADPYGTYNTAEETARVLLALYEEEELFPSITVLVGEDLD